MSEKNIKRLFNVIDNTLFTINGKLSYERTLEAIERLCKEINNTETDEFIWSSVGEGGMACLGDLLVGAYWFLFDYHGGAASLEYRVYSALCSIYSPGISDGVEEDTAEEDTYQALEALCPYRVPCP